MPLIAEVADRAGIDRDCVPVVVLFKSDRDLILASRQVTDHKIFPVIGIGVDRLVVPVSGQIMLVFSGEIT